MAIIDKFYTTKYKKKIEEDWLYIKLNFDKSDDTIYEWKIFSDGHNYRYAFTVMFEYQLLPISMSLILYFAISYFLPEFAFHIARVVTIWYLIKLLLNRILVHFTSFLKLKNILFNSYIFKSGKVNRDLSFFLAGYIYLLYSNRSIFQDLFSSYSSITNWLLFYLDNFLKIVLLDTLEIMDIKFSTIKAISWKGKLALYFLNLLLTVGVIDTFLSIYRQIKLKLIFHGTTKEFLEKATNILSNGAINTKFKRLGSLSKMRNERSLSIESFVFSFDELMKLNQLTKEGKKKDE